MMWWLPVVAGAHILQVSRPWPCWLGGWQAGQPPLCVTVFIPPAWPSLNQLQFTYVYISQT
jgi:hypothetical protein